MTSVSYPGVYVEEIAGGAKPIEVASTSTAAFVGVAQMGPTDKALRVTSWDEYLKYYGSFIKDSFLAESVFQYFNNGGRQCYIVRVKPDDTAVADVTVKNRAGEPKGVKFSAKNEGTWGNFLYLTIENGTNDPGNEFKLTIRRQELADVLPDDINSVEPVEIHDNLSADMDASNYVVDILKRDSSILSASVLDDESLQQGFHLSDWIKVPKEDGTYLKDTERRFLINIDHDGYQTVELPSDVDATDMDEIKTAIIDEVKKLKDTKKKTTTQDHAFSEFGIEIADKTVGIDSFKQLKFVSGTNKPGTGDNVNLSSIQIQNAPTNNAAAALKIGDANGGVSEDALAVRRPVNRDIIQVGDAAPDEDITGVTPGEDGSYNPIHVNDYSGAFKYLDDKTDFSLLLVPGIGVSTMVDEGMAYCEKRPLKDVFYIGEMEIEKNTPSEAEAFRKSLTKPNSYGAVYYPWIKAMDPSGKSATPIELPPAGYIAGLYARIDTTRGVWKAPAGTEASLSGAVGLTSNLTDAQQGTLNLIGINCIRRFDAAGIVSWGARTISTDPEYKYVPVRRTAVMLKRSIYDGIQWAVFEPNDERLWSSLRLNIGSFMNGLFRAGAFQGSKVSDAYFVRCGLGDTMTQGDIDRGQVIVLVGFAPVKPAEFVIVRIQQKVGQQ